MVAAFPDQKHIAEHSNHPKYALLLPGTHYIFRN